MKKAYVAAIIAASVGGLCFTSLAEAQSTSALPNYGGYRELDGTFRVGVNVTNQLNGFQRQDGFSQDSIENIADYLNPAQLTNTIGQLNARTAAIDGIFDVRGATARAGFAQNSTAFSVRIVDDSGATISNKEGESCSFNYALQTRQASFDEFDEATDDENAPTSQKLLGCLTRAFVTSSPVDPLAGNPNSLQSTLARGGLDLSSGDSAIEENGGDTGGGNSAGDPWIIGGSIGFGSAGRFDLVRVDFRTAATFRVFEGGRSRLKFDMPINYTKIGDAKAFGAQIGLALEVPLTPNFSIEPRAAYGATGSVDVGQIGHIAQGSLTARYAIHGVGRGRIVLGFMGGYSQTLGTPFTDLDLDPGLKNGVFRGGIAYDTPLTLRIGGRLTALRGSYGYTRYTGDALFNNNFHELTLSFGLRTREEQVRGSRDLVRFNVGTIQAENFQQYTFGLGFRF